MSNSLACIKGLPCYGLNLAKTICKSPCHCHKALTLVSPRTFFQVHRPSKNSYNNEKLGIFSLFVSVWQGSQSEWGRGVGMDLPGEWHVESEKENASVYMLRGGRGSGLDWEGGGRAFQLLLRVWNSSWATPPPPNLAGTCENNSPAFSHSADPIAISTLEGMRQSR